MKEKRATLDRERCFLHKVLLTVFDSVIHQELSSDEPSSHNHPGSQASKETLKTCFPCEDGEAVGHRTSGTVAFIDLA